MIDGSSTVAPIGEAITEEFNKQESGSRSPSAPPAPAAAKFCNGETDISDASRAINDEEQQACAAKGIKYQEFRIGLDGLAVVTSSKNTFLDTLNFKQMAEIFKQGGATTWRRSTPASPTRRSPSSRRTPSRAPMTFSTRRSSVTPRRAASSPAATTPPPPTTTPWSRASRARPTPGLLRLRLLPEQQGRPEGHQGRRGGGRGASSPTTETITSGDYPLSRPLYIYVKEDSLKRPEVGQYVKFYLEQTRSLIADVGYVAAPRTTTPRAWPSCILTTS